MKFDVELPGGDQSRKAFRTSIPGFFVKVLGKEQTFPVKDLSATGFAIEETGAGFREGEALGVELYLKHQLFLGELKARVMRVVPGRIVGCNFEQMNRRQEARLDKLVLEVQKRLIQLRKEKRETGE